MWQVWTPVEWGSRMDTAQTAASDRTNVASTQAVLGTVQTCLHKEQASAASGDGWNMVHLSTSS